MVRTSTTTSARARRKIDVWPRTAAANWLIPFPTVLGSLIITGMERPAFQMTVAAMLALIACVAFNFWLFRLGAFWGILGLNVTKHVAIAYLCQVLGVDRRQPAQAQAVLPARPPHFPNA